MFERRTEEFPLTERGDIGNNNDHSGMQRFFSMELKEIGAIVRYERIFVLADGGHEFPVFRTAQTEIVDMIRHVTCSVG
jgi:hypothetical protein